MKNLNTAMASLLAFFVLLISCNNGNTDSVKRAKEANAARSDSQQNGSQPPNSASRMPPSADADFLVNAMNNGLTEVQLARLAWSRSINQRIRSLGKIITDAQQDEKKRLKELASRKNVVIPDSISDDRLEALLDLQKKRGDDFDKHLIDLMVRNYKEAVGQFEGEAGKGSDSLISSYASSRVHQLRRFLDSTMTIQKLMDMSKIGDVTPVPK